MKLKRAGKLIRVKKILCSFTFIIGKYNLLIHIS